MKKLVLILLLIPTLALSQVSSWRGGSPSPSMRSSGPIMNNVPSPRDGMSSWRDYSPREFNRPPQTKPGSNIIVTDPYWGWGWNRWGLWGAPMFGWDYYSPFWYYNSLGYRQPARVYVYKDGKKDTVYGKRPQLSFGLQKSQDKQVGGWFTMGNQAYFIMDYAQTVDKDNSTFFPYGNIGKVDFPLVEDLVKKRSFYVGLGKRFNRTGIHMMLGSVREDVRWRGKDDIGYITFPKYVHERIGVKVGAIHDFKNVSLKVDYDPIVNNLWAGLGINF